MAKGAICQKCLGTTARDQQASQLNPKSCYAIIFTYLPLGHLITYGSHAILGLMSSILGPMADILPKGITLPMAYVFTD